MACPICGGWGPGDPSVGIMEDDGVCPVCAAKGWEECGCRVDDETNEFVPCSDHTEKVDTAPAEQRRHQR